MEKPVAVPVSVPVAPAAVLPLAGRKVIVADDEPDQVEFIATVLEDQGAVVFRATDADHALALARRERPDLLTLDLAMPGRDVGEVLEIVRRDPALRGMPVCVITGRPELRKLIYDRAVRPPEGYLDKPVSEAALMRNVRKILEVAEHTA
jgi:CheY-like chemotaxis protein